MHQNLHSIFQQQVWQLVTETLFRKFSVKKFMLVENSINEQISPKIRISKSSDAEYAHSSFTDVNFDTKNFRDCREIECFRTFASGE